MARIPWVGQSAVYKSSNIGDVRLVNGYAEVEESKQGKTVVAIHGTPGLRRFTQLSFGGPIRGIYKASNDRLFAVQGNAFVELFASGSYGQWGTLLSVAGPVSMTDNTLNLALVDGQPGGLYSFTFATNAFKRTADPEFTAASRVSFLDSYLLFPELGTQKFWWTDLFSINIDALNFSSADAAPDQLVTQLVIHRELWNFGFQSTEIWYNTGDPDGPFSRIGGGFIHQGCAAAQSPARVAETVIWLSGNDEGRGMVVQAQGYTPQRISTHAVEQAMQHYTTLEDAIGWAEQMEGHAFYWLTFPTANHTWVYDLNTGLWHERAYLDPNTGFFTRHRANCYAVFFGSHHMVGDREDGRIYRLDDTVYTDDGQALRLEATMPPLFDAEGNSGLLEQPWLMVDVETGVGLDNALVPGQDPQIMLEISNDGGHSFGPALTRSMGKLGKYKTTVEWRRLGAFRDRRVRISISDPVKRAILSAVTDVRPLLP